MQGVGHVHSLQKKKQKITQDEHEISWRGYKLPPKMSKMNITPQGQKEDVSEKIKMKYRQRLEIARRAGKVNKTGYGKVKPWQKTPSHLKKVRSGNKNALSILEEQMKGEENRRELKKLYLKYKEDEQSLTPKERDLFNRLSNDTTHKNFASILNLLGSINPKNDNGNRLNLVY